VKTLVESRKSKGEGRTIVLRCGAPMRERFNAACDVPRRAIQIASRTVREANTEEDCLRYLGQLLGDLSREILFPHGKGTRETLQKMFALATCWMARVRRTNEFRLIIAAVFAERQRQEELRRANPKKYSFALSSLIADPRRKLRVVFEECGEVANACDELEQSPAGREAREHLFDELSHVAACCEAWLESFETTVNGGAR
jgi:NTP pyrophosphatase (non-canonical NTP hydrolase)